MKKIKFLTLVLSALFLAACSDSDDYVVVDNLPSRPSVLVLNQGNQGNKIAASIDMLSLKNDSLYTNVFESINKSALGYGAQNAAIAGGKIFVALFDENLISVFDQEKLTKVADVPVASPEYVLTANGNVYVAGNDGFVTRIRPASLDTAMVYVGPNPMGLVQQGNNLYVSISDAYNYLNNYENGKRVVRIDLSSFTVAGEVEVGLNPTSLAADADGNIYVACQGNYYDVPAQVWKITGDKAAYFADGSMLTAKGKTVYIINSVSDFSEWPIVKTVNDYAAYNNDGKRIENFTLTNAPSAPISITADPSADRLYITSDAAPGDYTSNGILYVCTATSGTFVRQYTTGVHPFAVLFNR